jgi:hypothetical protein
MPRTLDFYQDQEGIECTKAKKCYEVTVLIYIVVEGAIQAYFEPMLKSIETLCHISIKSQILYLSNLNLKPQYDSKNEYHYLTQNDLGLAINTGSQLSSHSTSNPTLNFLTYIPTSRNR